MSPHYGAIPDTPDKRDKPYRERRAAAQAASGERELPERIDNRDECTSVWEQQTADCVGQALVGWAEMAYWKPLGHPPAFSPTAAYRWGQLHDPFPGEDYDGTTLRGGLRAWARRGMCPLVAWSYGELEGKPGAAAMAQRYPLRRYEALHGIWETKHAIHQYGAVVATFNVHYGWEHPEGDLIPEGVGEDEYHAVKLCGYDDRGFLVKNSWGNWCDGGFGFLQYADFERNAENVWLPMLTNGWWSRLVGLLARR